MACTSDSGAHKNHSLQTVIAGMYQLVPSDVECLTLESEPHLHPDELQGVVLQAMIDDITADTKSIILGHGFDSLWVIGLNATDNTFVIPRQDD